MSVAETQSSPSELVIQFQDDDHWNPVYDVEVRTDIPVLKMVKLRHKYSTMGFTSIKVSYGGCSGGGLHIWASDNTHKNRDGQFMIPEHHIVSIEVTNLEHTSK